MTELPWKPTVFIPVNLTVSLGDPLQHDGDPRPWCVAKAAELLGSDNGSRQHKKLAQCLEKYVTHFRTHQPLITAALFFYPDFSHLPPWGTAEVKAFGEHSEKGPLTIAMLREFYDQPDELSFGQTELSETQVPAGPALRVHRYRRTQPTKRRSPIGEELVWLIWPPETTAVITILVQWLEPALSEAGVNIADDMARNFRLKPPDQG
jgi:hypothetical protein